MIEKRVKFRYWYVLVAIFVLIPLITLTMLVSSDLKSEELTPDYVSDEIINDSLPVINETTKVINPYIDQSVTIGKKYYDYKGEAKDQENSILVHDNTYIQNTGIDYVSENKFEVVSILDGIVVTVRDDQTLGKIIEVKHKDNIISSYQSLSEVSVKEGDEVKQGTIIGKSGTSNIQKDMGSHLHFELTINSQTVDPEEYYEKELGKL